MQRFERVFRCLGVYIKTISEGTFLKSKSSLAPTKNDLVRFRSRALKWGVWFQALGTVERTLLNLAIRTVHRVRNRVLYKALVSIANRLNDSFDHRVSPTIRMIDFPCAQKLSLLAQNWGNTCARNWMFDLSFVRFMVITHANSPSMSLC